MKLNNEPIVSDKTVMYVPVDSTAEHQTLPWETQRHCSKTSTDGRTLQSVHYSTTAAAGYYLASRLRGPRWCSYRHPRSRGSRLPWARKRPSPDRRTTRYRGTSLTRNRLPLGPYSTCVPVQVMTSPSRETWRSPLGNRLVLRVESVGCTAVERFGTHYRGSSPIRKRHPIGP